MGNNINNNNENRNETSVDYELVCTICSKPSNDPQSFPCGHTFCRQCITQKIEKNHVSCPTCQQPVTINNFPEINHAVCRNVKDLPMKHDKDKQTALRSPNIHNPVNGAFFAIDEHNLSSDITLDQNEQQNKYSAARLFEPFKDLLIDLINQNKQFREEINQIKKQNQPQFTEQPKKNEELQLELDQLKEQNHLQFTEQSKKNEKFQLRLNQLIVLRILVTCIATISGILLLFYYFSVAYSNPVATTNQSQLQLNEQSRKIEYLKLELDQLREQSQLHLTDQSKKNEDLQLAVSELREQNQLQLKEQSKKNEELQFELHQLKEQSRLQLADQSETNQRLNLLEINVKSIQNIVKYLPREYILMFQRRKIVKKEHGNENVLKK